MKQYEIIINNFQLFLETYKQDSHVRLKEFFVAQKEMFYNEKSMN